MHSALGAAVNDLYAVLGNFLDRRRTDGIFELAVLDAGDRPLLLLDLLPQPVTQEQRARISGVGYVWHSGREARHAGGWTLHLSDSGAGEWPERVALNEYQSAGHNADLVSARRWKMKQVSWTPVAQALSVLSDVHVPMLIASGWALDVLAGQPERLHDDLDLELPREAQAQVCATLSAQGWRLDVCLDGQYLPWEGSLPDDAHQVHARHPDFAARLLDLVFSDFSGGLWHYRRGPQITLPLSQARRFCPARLPYLAPQAVLLFKGTSSAGIRAKDQADFERTLPRLSADEQSWLAEQLPPNHTWIRRLTA